MPRVCTNLRTTPGLFKKWRHEALCNEGFCLDIWTTWGYFELLCLSLECAFIKIWSDPNPSKTTYKYHNELRNGCIMLRDYGILNSMWYFHVIRGCQRSYTLRWSWVLPYLPVYRSTFFSLKIYQKNRPRLIHESKTEIIKSSAQISIIIVSYGNKHPLLHGTSYDVFSLIDLSSSS